MFTDKPIVNKYLFVNHKDIYASVNFCSIFSAFTYQNVVCCDVAEFSLIWDDSKIIHLHRRKIGNNITGL